MLINRSTTITHRFYSLLNLYLFLCVALPSAAHATTNTQSLRALSLDELSKLDVLVTSASKKIQKLSETAASMFVITQDDIRNSGATTLPDALRMAPGIHVARIDVNKWSVTSRGFSGRFANKLLVMIDGRSIYNPLFSGTHWDSHNAQMENIDRIEIIRGPGAAMWGANAVNGVINIITKPSNHTQGTMLSATTGSETHQGFARHGGSINDTLHYRVYGNYKYYDDSIDSNSIDTADQFDLGQTGARLDWQIDQKNQLTVLGDYHKGSSGHNKLTTPQLTPPFSASSDQRFDFLGGNINIHWSHQLADHNIFDFKIYFDSMTRESNTFAQTHHTLDIESNHQFIINQHALNWGAGYRVIFDDYSTEHDIVLDPANRNTQLFSFFIQDEISLIPDQFKAIFAIRIEHNDYSGLEYQPTARLFWTPDKNHSLWAAFSRAVRTPARNTDVRIDQRVIPGSPPTLISIFGDSAMDAEEIFAYEAGYNFNFSDRFKLSLAAFFNEYDELLTLEPRTPTLISTPIPHILLPVVSDNKMRGESYGFEASGTWHVNNNLKLNAAYTFTKINLKYKDNSLDTSSIKSEGETPQQQLSFRIDTQPVTGWNANFWLRYVDSLPAQQIKAYLTLDARIAWQPFDGLELSVVGQNLINGVQMEYSPEIVNISSSKIERSIYGRVVLQF